MTTFKYLQNIGTDQIKSSGYVEAFDDVNLTEYRIVEGPLPEGAVFEVVKSGLEMVTTGRAQMLEVYKAAPLSLRDLFSDVITKVNALLDLQDFELALVKAQAVDVSIITDATLRESAQGIKDLFVQGLTALKDITGQ